jgi:hypothetical protein
MRASFLAVLAVVVAACSSDKGSAPSAPASPAWSKTLIPSSELAPPRGWQIARGVIHFHSVYSHDACDNWWPLPDGGAKTAADIDDTFRTCDAQMRAAVCSVGHDFVFITDHPAYMADFTMEQLLHLDLAAGDEAVVEGGKTVANRVHCENGMRPLLFAGHEDALMSLGLHEHLPGAPDVRKATYGGNDAATIDALHAVGALANVAHTESKDLAYLEATPIDGLEVYNLHANIDPRIRGADLGLDPYGFAGDLLEFTAPADDAPEPDLAMLAFLTPNDNARNKWDALLTMRDVVGTAGTDVHQNAIPGLLSDGERGDSYRRLMRWISNDVLVHDRAPGAIQTAVGAGRLYSVIEVLGTPIGFDFAATAGSGAVAEMGEHVKLSDQPTFKYVRPTLGGIPLVGPPPVMHARLLRATEAGGVEVASGDGDLTFTPTEPGAYRLEVWIGATHLAPYLRRLADKYTGRTFPWIYSNAIHVDP